MDNAKATLGDAGIQITFRVPEANLDRKSINESSIKLSTIVVSETVTESVVKEGLWYKVMNWIDDDWGREDIEWEEEHYIIDKKQDAKDIQKGLKSTLIKYQKQHIDVVLDNIRKECKNQYDVIHGYLAQYNQALIDGLQEQKSNKGRSERWIKSATRLQSRAGDIRDDVREAEKTMISLQKAGGR